MKISGVFSNSELDKFIEHNKQQTEALKKLVKALEKSTKPNNIQQIKIEKDGNTNAY